MLIVLLLRRKSSCERRLDASGTAPAGRMAGLHRHCCSTIGCLRLQYPTCHDRIVKSSVWFVFEGSWEGVVCCACDGGRDATHNFTCEGGHPLSHFHPKRQPPAVMRHAVPSDAASNREGGRGRERRGREGGRQREGGREGAREGRREGEMTRNASHTVLVLRHPGGL